MVFVKTHDISELNEELIGKQVVLGGWIEDLRKLGKMSFITLRDVSGISQVIVKGELNDNLGEINRQSVVSVKGIVQETKARDFAFEIKADEIEVLGKAIHPLPVDPIGRLESNIDTRLNHRALDMRNQRTASIFKMRHHVLQSLRKTLADKKFLEITTPKIIGSASEGGADLFSLEYFGKTAYLISNFYRAENSHTGRHLTEFTSIDIEAAFMDYEDVMNVLEALVLAVYKDISENCKAEQEIIEHTIEVPSTPFERVTYTQCIEELKKEGEQVEFGDDLLDSHLRIIGKNHPGFFFLTDWPMKLKPFYIREKDEDATLSRSFDLQYGFLELSSGGTRLHNPEMIKERLKEQGLDPTQFADHLKTFDWGMPPHSGWGMGLERLMTTLIGIDNVREVVLYPRDPDRLSP
jgi:aspartyl-tRNA synthetase